MNGRALFTYNPDLFKEGDDADGESADTSKPAKEEEEKQADDGQIKEKTEVDESLFQGEDAGDDVTTGSNNTIIGRQTNAGASGAYDVVVIGAGLNGKGDSTGFYGGSSGVYNSDNSSYWQTTSDARIKKNIIDNNTGLEKIKQIRVRNFEYRTPEEVDPALPSHSAIDKQGIQVGVIAQEIQEVLPDLVRQTSLGCYSVNPNNLTWYLVNAVKELAAEVEKLKNGS